MYWTLELAHHLEEAPWPATRDELIDYAIRSGAPLEVIENLQAMEDEGEIYENGPVVDAVKSFHRQGAVLNKHIRQPPGGSNLGREFEVFKIEICAYTNLVVVYVALQFK